MTLTYQLAKAAVVNQKHFWGIKSREETETKVWYQETVLIGEPNFLTTISKKNRISQRKDTLLGEGGRRTSMDRR